MRAREGKDKIEKNKKKEEKWGKRRKIGKKILKN